MKIWNVYVVINWLIHLSARKKKYIYKTGGYENVSFSPKPRYKIIIIINICPRQSKKMERMKNSFIRPVKNRV